MPGAVVAIARKGKLVYYEAFGFLNKTAGTPMPKDAIFPIASMTKPLTTVGALMLVEEGRLLLNDPVGEYLPQLGRMSVAVMRPGTATGTEAARRQPTIQDLMRHTAGVTYGNRGTSELYKMYPQGSWMHLAILPDRSSLRSWHRCLCTTSQVLCGTTALGLMFSALLSRP